MKKYFLSVCLLFFWCRTIAHPMPSSIVNLSVLENIIYGEAKIPLAELESAVGEQSYNNINNTFFRNYFSRHIVVLSGKQKWITEIEGIEIATDKDPIIGNYQEVLVHFKLMPPETNNLRKFTFHYDAVIHQVITHKIMVFVKQDWQNGIRNEEQAKEIGIIQLDVPTGKITPLEVNLEQGNWWKGFGSMLMLGMQHIKEGTDHLLFILVLLLPCMLLHEKNHWGKYGGIKYSLSQILKIVTAFTIGHSLTLLIGALGWVKLPSQPVEILIAFSILISAIHAVYPVFSGKEKYIAIGFGLIHGLAFSSVLAQLNTGTVTLIASILGFNLGIELMQLGIIALVIPWLILLSQTSMYRWLRTTGAIFASMAALGWIAERVSGKGNFISVLPEKIAPFAIEGIVVLALLSVFFFTVERLKNKPVN